MSEETVKIEENTVDDAEMEVEEENTTNGTDQKYKHREDFTSEIYKIEINNMAKFGFGVRNSFYIEEKKTYYTPVF